MPFGALYAVADGENIELAVGRYHEFNDLFHVRVHSGVAGNKGAVDALGLELVFKRLEFIGASRRHDDLSPLITVSLGNRSAQSAGSAGDEGDLAGNAEHALREIFFDFNHVLSFHLMNGSVLPAISHRGRLLCSVSSRLPAF